MKNKSLIALVATSFLIFILLIFSVYKISTKKSETFYTDGYVSVSDVQSSKKIYFEKGTNYKKGYNKQIVFKDKDNVKQEVSKYSFVLYADKSINYLSDGVLMDLDRLDETFIPYYNIKSNYLINYKDNKYIIDSKDQDIILNNFIGKISDNKYIVAGNNLKLKVSSSEEMISGYYFELNFGEGNLVKIDNDSVSLETISDECYIMVGNNIRVDLSKQAIYYGEDIKAYLSEIIIDNDANIDIKYEDVKESEGNGSSGGEGEGTGNQTVIPDTNYEAETVIEYKNVPYVEIIGSNTNPHQIALDFRVNDMHNLITGSVKVRYTNINTGYTEVREYENYAGTINYIIDNLNSNSDYLISIYASYIRNGNIFADYRMFQRVYTTKELGVKLEKDYVDANEVAYKVLFDENANFESVTVSLYDRKGKMVDQKEVANSSADALVVFTNLNSDEKYSIRVENFNHGNIVYSVDDYIEGIFTTLKQNPFKSSGTVVASPTAIVNKKDYTVKFSLGEIDDVNNSIKSAIYYVYNAQDNSLVDTISRENINDFEIKIGDKIKAYIDDEVQTYYFNAVVTLEDNEKLVDFKTENSNTFNIESKMTPTMKFVSDAITANTINGRFEITDQDNTMDVNEQVYAEYIDGLGNSNTKVLSYTACPEGYSSSIKCVDLSLDGLNSDDSYTLRLMGYVDLKDKDVEPGIVQIGAVKIVTEKADIILTDISARDLEIDEATEKMFELSIGFSLDQLTDLSIRDNMSSFDIILYEGTDVTGTYLSTMHVDGETDIVEEYFNNKKILTLNDFKLTIDDIRNIHITNGSQMSKRYTIRLTNGVSGSDFVEFKPYTFTFEINSALLDILNGSSEIAVTPILNGSLDEKAEGLNDDTIVGLKVTPTFGNKSYAKRINITIVDVTNNIENLELTETNHITKSYELDLAAGSIIPEYEFLMSDESLFINEKAFLKRGRIYRVMYTLELDLNGDGNTDMVYPFSPSNVNEPAPVISDAVNLPKQTPTMVIFPWESNDNSVIYKYHVNDIDRALPNNYNVSYSYNDSAAIGEKIACANPAQVSNYTSKYDCVRFNNLNKGDEYEVFISPVLIDGTASVKTVINTYTFEGIHNISDLSYRLVTDEEGNAKYNNILALEVIDTNEDNSVLNRVAYYTVELSTNNGKFRIDNINNSISTNPLSSNMIYYTSSTNNVNWLSTNNDTSLSKVAYVADCDAEGGTCIYIDYSKLYTSNVFKDYFMPFRNKDIEVSLTATYDSGEIAYSAKVRGQKYAVQVVSSTDVKFNSEVINNKYFILNHNNVNNNSIAFSDSALSGVYLYDYAEGGFADDNASDNTSFDQGKLYLINSIYSNFTTNVKYNNVNLAYTVNRQGINVLLGNKPGTSVPIVMKKLVSSQIGENIDFKYERVIPSLNISISAPTINGLKLNSSLIGVTESEILEEGNVKYIYFEIYDENNTLVKTVKVNKDNLTRKTCTVNNNSCTIEVNDDYKVDITSTSISTDTADYSFDYKTGKLTFNNENVNIEDNTEIYVNYYLVLDNLEHNKDYTLKAFVKMDDGDKVYLSGYNNNYETLAHSFKTKDIADVKISSANFEVQSELDYATRKLLTAYQIDDIVGITSLTYEICNSDNTVCVDTTKYYACDNSYNSFNGTCFNKSGSSYASRIMHDISITDNFDFIFNTSYNLKINANVYENGTEQSYEVYNSTLPVRALSLPTIDVIKTSHFDNNKVPYLQFLVTFNDEDRVVSIPENGSENGTYYAYLAYGAEKAKILGTEQVLDIVKNNAVYTADIKYENLNKLTEYYLIIDYNVHANNAESSVNQTFSIPYLIYTLDDNGVSIGKLEYQAEKNATILKFGYATNILKETILDENDNLIDDPNQEAYVAGIHYTITRKSGDNQFRMESDVIFDGSQMEIKEDDSSLGDRYYQLTIKHGTDDEYSNGYPVTAGYNIFFKFYLGGNIAKEFNTEDKCLNNNISNKWDSTNNKCYILDTGDAYKADTIYGG